MGRGDRDEESVSIEDVRATAETDAAILCKWDDHEEWIPKSQIHEDSEVYEKGHEGTLVITAWIARQKNIG